MDSNKFLNKYVQLYLNLHEEKLPKKNYQLFQHYMHDFISNFPEIDMGLSNTNDSNLNFEKIVILNFDKIYRYLLSQPFLLEFIPDLLNMINKNNFLQKAREIQIHLEEIINIIQTNPTENFKEKKRIYLGILWFLIGYYICFMIHQIEGFSSFPNLLEASRNKFIVFLTCCFIFYDDILDLQDLDIDDKKWCLGFTKFFFETILHKNNYKRKIEMLEIESNFLENTKIKTTNQLLKDKTLRLLDVCLQEKNKLVNNPDNVCVEKERKMLDKKVRLIYDLFQTEVRISKSQKEMLDRPNILINLLTKSQKSIEVILTCLVPFQIFSENTMNLTYKFSFVSQLLDDLNDIEDDYKEGNITIFQESISKTNLEIVNTLKYIFYIQKELEFTQFSKKYEKLLKSTNHLANMLVFNYAIGKNVNLKLDPKLEKFKYIRNEDIIKFRVRKLEFQKNLGNFSFK